ncbi:unnamed protein product [Boreogadus saida]
MPEIPSQGIASRWTAEDLDDFSPPLPDDRPLGPSSTRTSPPSALRHAAYYHGRRPPRPITEDPDSVLNQSEAVARRSLILAATAPPQQAFVQHQASHSCPVQGDLSGQRPADAHQPHERISFTKKMVHALSPKTSKAPTLDISQPVAISVPAKVLEMIGGRAGESQHLATSDSPQSPQMISMLLRSCDIQLSDTCQQELNSKLGATALGMAKGPNGAPPAVQKPPLPKNPARLMALALAESANRAEGASLPYRPPQTGYRPPPHPGYSHQDPESNQQPGLSPEAKPPPPYSTEPKHVDMGTLSSTTSGSDPVTSDLSRVNSSEDDQSSDPFYSSVHVASRDSPVRMDRRQPPAYGRQLSAPPSTASGAGANAAAATATATATGLRQQSDSVPQLCSGAPHPAGGPPSQPQLHHSSSESSPLSRARLPPPAGRPRVPAKPSDLVAPKREPPFQRGGRDLPLQVAPAGPQREPPHPFARTNLRRSLDSGTVRCLIGPPDFQSPLVRAFSERLGGIPDKLARYHAAQTANQLVAGGPPPSALALAAQHHFAQASIAAERLRDKQNPYHEIGGPEGEEPYPFRPPSYSRHAFGPPRPDLEGSLFPAPRLQPRPQPHSSPEAYHGPAPSHPPQHHALPEASHFPLSHGDLGPAQQAPFTRPPAGSEMHPIPASCFSALAPAAAAASRTFSSPRKACHAPASLHASNPPNPQPAPLHPYFENGRVCYRDQPEDAPPPPATAAAAAAQRAKRPTPSARRHGPQRPYRPPAEPRQPVYVNYPFSLSSAPPPPAAASASSSVALPVSRGWATSDLDTPRERSPLTSPGDSRSSGSLPSPPGSGGGGGRAGDERAPGGPDQGPCAAAAAAKRSWSEDEDAEPLSGHNLAELLMAKMAAEEDGNEADSDSPSRPGPSSSSRRQTHLRGHQYPGPDAVPPPPPPYAAALFSCSSFQQAGVSRRASSGGGGGQYHRQSYDVHHPPQDPLLRFQRAPDPPSRLNPRSSRSCHNPLYPPPPRRSPHAYPPPGLFGLPSGDPVGYLAQNMHQAAAAAAGPRPPHQAQGSPPGEAAPETSALRGVVGQNGVPGAKWSQTRSYC